MKKTCIAAILALALSLSLAACAGKAGGVYVVGNTGYEMYNYVGSLAEKYQQIVNGVADDLGGTATVYVMASCS